MARVAPGGFKGPSKQSELWVCDGQNSRGLELKGINQRGLGLLLIPGGQIWELPAPDWAL